MDNKNILIISLILLILSLTAVSASDFNDINVNESSGGDDSLESNLDNINVETLDDKTSPGTFDDLQLEVNNAPAGSVLNLTRNYNGYEDGTVYINKDLTIDGQGHTIDCLGKDMSIAFTSESGTITLKNLKIINGCHDAFKDNNNGGAIIIKGSSKCTIDNCTFLNNFADDCGGAIFYSSSQFLNIINCFFKDNKVDDQSGGAICSVGGKGMMISDCIFEENTGLWGGAIRADCYMIISSSSFKFNEASALLDGSTGGAVYCAGDTIIRDSKFIGNKANVGGAIYGQYIAFNNCIFESNRAETSIRDGYGGAIKGDSLNINNCSFVNNYADDYGGAVFAKQANINLNQPLPLNTYFINNKADDNDGGAVYVTTGLNVENTVFNGNAAKVDGGAIYSRANVNVKNCLFESNRVGGAKIECFGGAIRAKDDVYIYNSTFKNNKAEDYGGAIYATNVYINSDDNRYSFFIGNEAGDEKGGSIFAYMSASAENTVFTGNKALVDGGAIYSKNVYVKNCSFESNKVEGARIPCFGGAIRAEIYVEITHCAFKNNYAENNGGAVYANTLKLDDVNLFEGNIARDYGGAIYTLKFKENIRYAIFINNKAKTEDGGAVYIDERNSLTFSQCVFVNNHCGDEGGAIYLDSLFSYLTLKNNIFIGNSADDEGQTIYNKGYCYSIYDNYWGGNDPSKNNDQIIEFKSFPVSNIHHVDSNPLKMAFVFEQNPCIVNESIMAAVTFYHYDGSQCGEMYYGCIDFVPVENIDIANRTVYSSSVNIILTPLKTGTYTITAKLFDKKLSKDLTIMTPVKYMGFQKEQKKVKLTLKSVTVKKSANKIVLTATLKKGKNPLKKKSIVFKFNGKTYKTLTSSKGIAKVTIQKAVLKKLKVGIKIQYQAGYGKLKVKKTVKVKK